MYQLKIRNPGNPKDFRLVDLTAEEWQSWRTVFVETGVCGPEMFEGDNRRLVISYYPGTFPQSDEDDEILDLL